MALELSILDTLQKIHTPLLDGVMLFITSLGDRGIFWIIAGLLLVIPKKTRFVGIAVLIALIIDLLVVDFWLKPLIHRARPFSFGSPALLIPAPKDFSFPSGHTASSFAAATAIFIRSKTDGLPRRGVLAAVSIVVASLIAFSRLYLYVHFPTDVLAGAVLGVVFGVAAALILKAVLKIAKRGR